jgi:hypothetical protein
MKKSLTTLAMLASASMLAFGASAAEQAAVPMFKTLPAHGMIKHYAHQPTALATWNGSFTYQSHNYNFTMIGTNPASTNVTTNYTVYIIPVKMVYTKKVYKKLHATYDPNKDMWNGATITQSVLNSPIFTSMDWKWGSTDMGTTQYEDAFQRGSFWGDGISTTNTSYHVTITPTVLAEQTIKVSKAAGGGIVHDFGGTEGTMNINLFDNFIQTTMAKFSQINPSNFPFFLVENVYLTSGGCCIGGYHSVDNNGQTYGMASFVTTNGAFSQDVDAISHELGEWYDDPLTNNGVECGILEVGDPIEGLANYGTFPVVVGSVTYHPQALTFLEYFGSAANSSANNWEDNENVLAGVTPCSRGG